MVRVRHVKFRQFDRAFLQICLLDFLDNAWEGYPKLHQLRGDLPIFSVVYTRSLLVGLRRKVQD